MQFAYHKPWSWRGLHTPGSANLLAFRQGRWPCDVYVLWFFFWHLTLLNLIYFVRNYWQLRWKHQQHCLTNRKKIQEAEYRDLVNCFVRKRSSNPEFFEFGLDWNALDLTRLKPYYSENKTFGFGYRHIFTELNVSVIPFLTIIGTGRNMISSKATQTHRNNKYYAQ